MRPVIIGGGHNGLVAAFYLARAGMRPLVLERRDVAGGAAVTGEIAPGFRVPTLAHAIGPIAAEIDADMGLAARGLEVVCPAVTTFTPLEGGRAVVLARDAWNSAKYLAGVSEHDAARYHDFEGSVSRIAGALATVLRETPPRVDGGAMDLLRAIRTARPFSKLAAADSYRLARWLPMPVADLVDEWFEHPGLQATIATRGLSGVRFGPMAGGTSASLLLEAARQPATPGAPCFIRGGPGALAAALSDVAREAGAEIRLSAEVACIEVTDQGVDGVRLATGERLASNTVLSTSDPVRTLGFIDPARLGPAAVSRVRHYRIEGSLAKLNVALDALPPFASDRLPPGLTLEQTLSGRIVIAPDVEYLERAADDAKYGRASANPWLECTIPSLTDPALAPPGRHVMSIYARYAPYTLRGASWSDQRAAFQSAVIGAVERYAPGFASRIVATQLFTPVDLESTFGLTGGHADHGELALDQLYFMRPLPGWSAYRTPIRGLYLGGAGTHPGGGLTGLNGAAAARAVLRDSRARR